MENVKLLVGLCAHRENCIETTASLVKLAKRVPYQFITSKGVYIGKAREELARAAITTLNNTHLLFVDSDIIFEPEDVGRLFKTISEKPNMGAVSGNYIKWDGSKNPTCMWDSLNKEQIKKKAEKLSKKGKPYSVDGFGAGFLLIDCNALRKTKPPWFINEEFAGEDYYFCKKLKSAGFSPAVDFGVKVRHIGPTIWEP